MRDTTMFALQHLTATSRRLGLGIALAALALTTIAPPSTVAAQATTIDAIWVAQTESFNDLVPATSDLEVTKQGKTKQGTTTSYHFRIKNLGPSAASTIHAHKQVYVEALIGNGSAIQDQLGWTLSLAPGQSQDVTVTCTPPNGYYCSNATTLVWLSSNADPNHNNDVATFPN
jgi:hypothetical protein